MLKKLLLFFGILFLGHLGAQKMYWVGGSGYWNDLSHWSYTSGGAPAGVLPSVNTSVEFDNNSAPPSESQITIHALHSFGFKNITALNTQVKIDIIGSPTVDLTIKGDVELNEYFYFKLNGKINLYPTTVAKYQFSHNKFNNDIYLTAHHDVAMGVISTTKSLNMSGNFKLQNSIIFAKDLVLNHLNLNLQNNTFQISQNLTLNNVQITNTSGVKSNIICQKNTLPTTVLTHLSSVPNLKLSQLTPQACIVTLTNSTNPTCSGACDGTATFNLSGCTNAPYSIQWLNTDPSTPCQTLPPAVDFSDNFTSTTYTVGNLCGCGTQYIVLFENSLGEQAAVQVSIINPAATLLSFSKVLPNCNGDCNGQIRVLVVSGVVPLTINWNPPNTNHTNIFTRDTLKNACAGNYSLTATNNNGCITTFTTNLTQPSVLVANGTAASVTCNSACNGSAAVAPTGGTAPYSFSWSSPTSTPSTSSTNSITSLCPGVVTATVTDSKTCTATYSFNITQPPAVTLTVTKTDLTCGNVCNGTASVSASGGLGPFTYSWSPSGGTAAQATGLCAGDYTCTVTNNGNCINTITVNIATPPTLTATPTQTNLICNNACIGAINLNPSGGTGAYSYSWSPSVSTGSTATSLCAGAYTFTLGDALGCRFSNTVTITEPPSLTLTATSTSVTCNGACDGSITPTVTGGTAPYTFTLQSPSSTVTTLPPYNSLCPATYTVRVTDANGCLITRTISITQPNPITVNITTVSPTCNGLCNGSITAIPSGGTAPYSFTLQSSSSTITTNPPYTNLCAGSYTLITGDARGCTRTHTINLTQPNPISLTLNATPINCANQCNASISTVVNGGTPVFTFTWSSGGTGSSINNQCVGVHTATVTDANGCQASASVSVVAPPALTVNITPTNPNCNSQCTGIATTSVTGGTPNYTINLSNGSSGNVINGLCQGVYTATVTDFNGCTQTQTVAITAPPALTLTPLNGTVSCAGSCDGTVSVVATGGTSGYFYTWSPTTPTQNTQTATGLCPGNYITTVTDSKGCVASATANVSQPTALTASISNVQPSCNVCIGAATAQGVGGTGPYTYSWAPGGQTTATANNLCVGIQTVTVTDSKGCIATRTVQINQTVITLITTNGATLACNNACTGIATANPTGGLAPYSYTWTSPPVAPTQNSQTATGLCSGVHTVQVTDVNGCSSTNTVSFANPPAITLTVNQANVSCNGSCNGTASATVTGGTGAINYLWQPGGQTTSSISGLCAGNYTVTASDANGCSRTQVITITESSSITATFTFTNPVTCTSTNGSIGVAINGGTSPYTFTWSPGASTSNPLTNVGAGTYSIVIRDFAGCTQTLVTTLNNPTGPTVTATSNSISCFGSCTGSATLSISGVAPFSVNWPTIPSTNTVVTGLCAGVYIPQITDANNCVTNQTVNIAQPSQITSTATINNVTCNAACNGSINITPTGGTPGYSFAWLPTGGSVEDPTSLCAGTYSVDITDANNCTVTNTFVITEPLALALSFNKKDVLCNASCTGGIKVLATGGTAPYSYTWAPTGSFTGANIDTIVNVCSGIYTVSVSDANGCVTTATVDINEPPALTSTIITQDVKCNNQCNGTATINATGGVSPYNYSYNTTPIALTQTVGGLCAGTYTGNVTDANGCVITQSFVINEPLPIVVSATVTNPNCNAACNGSVATSVTGGNAPYAYSWVPFGGSVPNPIGLCAGNYTITVTDDSLCTGQTVVTLTDPAILLANASFTNPTCASACNGIVTASPIGGTSPYTYAWSAPTNTNQTVSGLCSGTYTLVLSDANACQATQTVTLTDPTAITVNPGITPATCGSNNGSINATAVNGTAPYTYNWLPPVSGAQSTNTLVTGLSAGVYTVVVTDAASCSTTVSIPLSSSNGPSGATITSTNVTCVGSCNGAANITGVTGGLAPYTVSWINPVSTNSLVTGLCAGTYTAQVEDANNCVFFQSVTITQPQAIDDNEIITSATCLGICDGSIAVNPTGGNGTYTYSWSTGATTPTLTALCPGTLSLTITDGLNCTLTATYVVPGITNITANTFATNNACFSNCNGNIVATNVAGGLPPYSFVWTDPLGQTTAQANGLCNGTYSVTITDANGCINQYQSTITSPSSITINPTITDPACGMCNGTAVLNPTGGTPSYSYLWSNAQTGNTASGLCSGVYMVQVTDGNGCVSNSNVVINNSSGITSETILTANQSCSATCDGSATVTAIGGTTPISYHWLHDNSTSQSVNGLCPGTYYCNMTDANGCTRTATVLINSTPTLTLTSQVAQTSCSVSTGSISVNVTGGSGSYTYAWLPSGNTPSITNLAAGIYTLTVSDGNCSQTQTYAINSINGPLLSTSQQSASCNGVCDGSINMTISGGTPVYTIVWSNGASTNSINNLCAGNYSVLVTDAAGCSAVKNFSIATPPPIVFSVADVDNPLCNNNCNGVVTTIASGGILPYTYTWTTSTSTTNIANGLCAGNYSVTVADANSCPSTETYTLTGPPTISITATISNVTCNAATNGTINITVSGGVPGYSYTWTPTGSITTEDLENIGAGTYSLHLEDANGCSVDTSFVVTEPAAIDDNESITSAACFGNCNGSIALTPTGGVAPYTYSWTPSANTGTLTNLCPGPLTATITDANNCTNVFTYNIPSITTITSTTLAVDNICFNDCNGVLTATNIAGGVAPYTLQWNDPLGQVGNSAFGLCTGDYSVTITDANGCYNQIPAHLGSTPPVTFTPTITQPSCGACNGSAVINPVGGTPGYTYLWTNNQTSNTATNLCAGLYAVQITDANGCVNTTSVVINSSSSITGETITTTDVTCSGSCDGTASVTAVGGTAPISYHWVHDNSTTPGLTGLCAGVYYCNMIDANGCSRTASVVINAVTDLTVTSQVSQSSCTSSTGSITVNVSGGTGTYTYAWLPAGNTATLTNLAPGVYTLTVSDGNCSKTEIYTVQSFNAPSIASVEEDVSCSGLCDGSISITISGGTPTYTTAWSNGASTNTVSALCAGVYSVEVTDAAGCKAIRNYSLSTVNPIAFSAPDLHNPKCHDDCNGTLTAIPVGGTMPYTFTWTPNNVNTATTNSLCTGNYTITIQDANGCSATDSYSLSNPPTLTLTATITDASCNTAPDGAIDVTVSGGVTPYTYSWTPTGNTTEDLTNVLSGTHTLVLTDNGGCVIDSTFIINSTLTVNAIAGNDTIFCQNGTLQLDGSNSNGGVTYQWSEIPSGTVISNTLITTVTPATGTSTYVLTATNGVCIDQDTIVVNSLPLPSVDAGPMLSIPIFGTGTIGGNPTAPGGGTITWLPISGLDNPTNPNPTTSTTVTTIYTVTLVDANGCTNSDTVTVYVYPEITIPNGFSPNGDGKNDVWQIDFIYQFPDCEVEVYNRWGEQLFYSKGYAVPFNGKYKGKDLPVGTYYYVVKLNHPSYPKPFTSPLTIFR